MYYLLFRCWLGIDYTYNLYIELDERVFLVRSCHQDLSSLLYSRKNGGYCVVAQQVGVAPPPATPPLAGLWYFQVLTPTQDPIMGCIIQGSSMTALGRKDLSTVINK